jgi:monovalent cation:H+ antiporter-2, CPA2 family
MIATFVMVFPLSFSNHNLIDLLFATPFIIIMTTTADLSLYKNALIVLSTAAVLIPLINRLKITPVLGWLSAGAFLGFFVTDFNMPESLAELGIVFLMFLIGLELSLPRLILMKRLVFGLGSLQIILTALIMGFIAYFYGLPATSATLIGLSLALSSTAITVELLAQSSKMTTTSGRVSFSVLLMQDLSVVPLLFFTSVLVSTNSSSVFSSLIFSILNAIVILVLIILIGRIIFRPLFSLVASTGGTEFFMAAALLTVLGTGVAASSAGLSMALGGFTAGLLLAETEYKKAIETALDPFKGLLLGIFFMTVGMKLDPQFLFTKPHLYFGAAILLILIKIIIFYPLALLFNVAKPAAVEAAFLISSGGEFAFITLVSGALEPAIANYLLMVVALSMAFAPLSAFIGSKIANKLRPIKQTVDLAPHGIIDNTVLIVGSGRVGNIVSDMFKVHNISHILTDSDPLAVTKARQQGRSSYYGDAKNLAFLKACGLEKAKALVITIHTHRTIDEIVKIVRPAFPELTIIARARDPAHASHLYELGVSVAVPETFEASLQLSESALVAIGVSMGKVIASVHEKRDEYRAIMKKT